MTSIRTCVQSAWGIVTGPRVAEELAKPIAVAATMYVVSKLAENFFGRTAVLVAGAAYVGYQLFKDGVQEERLSGVLRSFVALSVGPIAWFSPVIGGALGLRLAAQTISQEVELSKAIRSQKEEIEKLEEQNKALQGLNERLGKEVETLEGVIASIPSKDEATTQIAAVMEIAASLSAGNPLMPDVGVANEVRERAKRVEAVAGRLEQLLRRAASPCKGPTTLLHTGPSLPNESRT